MPENKIEEPQKLQWIKGDKIGKVETIEKVEGEYTFFRGGGKIFNNVKSEFLMEVTDDTIIPDINSASIQPTQPKKVKQPKSEKTPLRLLLDKQKKLQKVKMGVDFSVKLPKKDIYDILESSFDVNELETELEKFIEDQINEEEILQTLKDSIKILIQERYKGV